MAGCCPCGEPWRWDSAKCAWWSPCLHSSPARYFIRFKGGSLGGTEREVRALDVAGVSYVVPVHDNSAVLTNPRANDALPQFRTRTETYKRSLRPAVYAAERVYYEYKWEDTSLALRKENERLSTEVRELRDRQNRLKTAYQTLQDIVRNEII